MLMFSFRSQSTILTLNVPEPSRTSVSETLASASFVPAGPPAHF